MGHFVERILDDDTGTKAIKFTHTFPYGCAMYVGMKSRKSLEIFQGSLSFRHGHHTQYLLKYQMANMSEEKSRQILWDVLMAPGKAMASLEQVSMGLHGKDLWTEMHILKNSNNGICLWVQRGSSVNISKSAGQLDQFVLLLHEER